MIPKEAKETMQGMVPAAIFTSSASGEPNSTVISQVYWVDEEHVAVSFQFFNTTARNLAENPKAQIFSTHPKTFDSWCFDGEFVRRETEGPLFDEMNVQLEMVASMQGMSDVFKLRGADVFRVTRVRYITVYGEPVDF